MSMSGIAHSLKEEQDRLTKELRGITAALAAFGRTYSQGMRTRTLSASGRARIAAAQKARWEKARTIARPKGEKKVVPIPPKRSLSAAGRKKIAAAQRVRWAKARRAKKAA